MKNNYQCHGLCDKIDCTYYCAATETCDYFLITGVRRGCSGTNCDKYQPANISRSKAREYPILTAMYSTKKSTLSSEEIEKVRELYNKGYLDVEIARLLKVPNALVSAWRKRNSLPSNYYNYGEGNEI